VILERVVGDGRRYRQIHRLGAPARDHPPPPDRRPPPPRPAADAAIGRDKMRGAGVRVAVRDVKNATITSSPVSGRRAVDRLAQAPLRAGNRSARARRADSGGVVRAPAGDDALSGRAGHRPLPTRRAASFPRGVVPGGHRRCPTHRVSPARLIQVGLRGLNYPEMFEFCRQQGIAQLTASQALEAGAEKVAGAVRSLVVIPPDCACAAVRTRPRSASGTLNTLTVPPLNKPIQGMPWITRLPATLRHGAGLHRRGCGDGVANARVPLVPSAVGGMRPRHAAWR